MTKEEIATGLKNIIKELAEEIQITQKEFNQCEDRCRFLQGKLFQFRNTQITLDRALNTLEEKE